SNIVAVHVNESDNLPPEWRAADVGAVPIVGNTVFKGDKMIVKGSGGIGLPGDSAGSRDAFRFVYRQLAQNGTLVARIEDFTFVDNSATTGLMIRKSLTADAPMAL